MAKERDYSRDKVYQGSTKQKKRRAKRNAARRKLMRAGRVSKGDGKDVDHRGGISKGNSAKNLRVVSKSKNRGFKRSKTGKNLGLK
jgi:hypothetical protein